MRRTIEIETSAFSESPSKRWAYGSECWVEDVVVEYPDSLDNLDDVSLLDMADDGDSVDYVIVGCQGNHDKCYGELWKCAKCGKLFCWAEGMDDGRIEICDVCWIAEQVNAIVAERLTNERT